MSRFWTTSGRPASPEGHLRVRPLHVDLSGGRARAGVPGNHLAVAWTGREYVCKAAPTFDMWDNDVFERWIEALTERQRKAIDSLLAGLRDKIDAALGVDFTVDTAARVKGALNRLNEMFAAKYDAGSIEAYVHSAFQSILEKAPEKYGERYSFLGQVRQDPTDKMAAKYLAKVTADSLGLNIGKYIDPEDSPAVIQRVKNMIDQGKSADEIAGDLKRYVTEDMRGNKLDYARLVADQMFSHARTYSALTSMMGAGFTQVQVVAALDDVTCPICRYMNGRVVDAEAAYRIATSAFKYTPAELEEKNPWMRMEGGKLKVGGTTVATAQETGAGEWGATGAFTDEFHGDLTKLRVALPPFHAYCRCTTVPVFGSRGQAVAPGAEFAPAGGGRELAPPVAGGRGIDIAALADSPLMKDKKLGGVIAGEYEAFNGYLAETGQKPWIMKRGFIEQYLNDSGAKTVNQPLDVEREDFTAKQSGDIRGWIAKWFRGKARKYQVPPVISKLTGKEKGAYHVAMENLDGKMEETIFVSKESFREPTFVHEYMHTVCHAEGWDKALAKYWKVQTAGEKAKWYVATGGAARFEAKVDKFIDPYMGRIYHGDVGGPEVLSTAASWMMQNPAVLYKFNPDLFFWVLAIFKGTI